jgi:hypothetical protein
LYGNEEFNQIFDKKLEEIEERNLNYKLSSSKHVELLDKFKNLVNEFEEQDNES